MALIAKTPQPPYYAVIFTSLRTDDFEGYTEMSTRMKELAARQPGYLGIESVREDVGITVSYWRDLESIRSWRADIEHHKAQQSGRERWYARYKVRIARVEHEHDFLKNAQE
jgi:heme-degrading monooxygenase HmoA